MNPEPTELDRVLTLLRERGDDGITAVDFAAPAVDGWKPILRVAARIHDLKTDGHQIVRTGTRNRCAVYVLQPAVSSAAAPTNPPEGHNLPSGVDRASPPPSEGAAADQTAGQLFHMPQRNRSVYDDPGEAA